MRDAWGRFKKVITGLYRWWSSFSSHIGRLGMYLSLVGAGALCIALRLPFLVDVMGTAIWINAFFLILGSIISGVGLVLRHSDLELVGYPLLITAMGVFALVFLTTDHSVSATLNGLLFLGFMFSLHGRSCDIRFSSRTLDALSTQQAE